jgi:hypothetical protein
MHFIIALSKSLRGFFFKINNVMKESLENMQNIVPLALMPNDRKLNFEYWKALYRLIACSKVCQYLRT